MRKGHRAAQSENTGYPQPVFDPNENQEKCTNTKVETKKKRVRFKTFTVSDVFEIRELYSDTDVTNQSVGQSLIIPVLINNKPML